MAAKVDKYLVTVLKNNQKITKVQKVGSAGELVDVEPEADQTYIPMVLGPWPKHRPKTKKKRGKKKAAKKKVVKKKASRKKASKKKKSSKRR